MDSVFTLKSQLNRYTWRALREDDLNLLAVLDAACWEADGEVSVPVPAYRALLDMPDVQMFCAAHHTHDELDYQIVAVGWMQPRGSQAHVRGKVHPQHRRMGLGTYLLRWLEEQADQPATLIIRNEAFNAGSAALYDKHGYARDFVELWMERDLRQPLPAIASKFAHTSWTETNAHQFFEVYQDAFKERPSFHDALAEDWIAEYVDDPDFRPDVSLLAVAGDEPVGFVTTGINLIPTRGAPVAWISQLGVRPAWRGRAVAADLIAAVMVAFQSEKLTALGLHVNINNPGAIHVYEQLGFKVVGQRAKYSKSVADKQG